MLNIYYSLDVPDNIKTNRFKNLHLISDFIIVIDHKAIYISVV
jgi:hypothetical protein